MSRVDSSRPVKPHEVTSCKGCVESESVQESESQEKSLLVTLNVSDDQHVTSHLNPWQETNSHVED